MRIFATTARLAVMSALALLIMTGEAKAYFDPGAGSMLLQALAAGLMAVALFWKRIKDMLRNLFGHKDKNNEG